MYSAHVVFMFALLQKMCTKPNYLLKASAVCGIETKIVLPFASTVTNVPKPGILYLQNTAKNVRILQWLALHSYVSSLPRDSSEAFQLTRQTSCLKSRQHQNHGGNLALYHIRIPNCIICHSTTRNQCEYVTMVSLTYVRFVPTKGLIRGLSANSSTTFSRFEELYPPRPGCSKAF